MLVAQTGCLAAGDTATFPVAAGLCLIVIPIAAAVTLSVFPHTRHIARVLLWICIGCVLGLNVCYQRSMHRLFTGLPHETVCLVEGRITADLTPLQGGRGFLQLDLADCGDGVQEATASGRLFVFFENRPSLSAGGFVRCKVGTLSCREDGSWVCSAKGDPQFLRWRGNADRVRASILDRVMQILDSTGAGESEFLTALLLGIRDDPADPFIGKFRRAGVSHVLALSGMHLGIVAGFVLFLTRPILGVKKAYLLTLPLLGLYIWIVGCKPSLLRAGVMYLLFAARIAGNRRPDSISLLACAFVCVLLIDPDSVSTLSFQLSFLALLGILTIGSDLSAVFSSYLPKGIALPLAMSIGAQIATAPVVASQFGILRPVGIIASIIISPLIVLYLWSGIIFMLLSFSSFLSEPVACLQFFSECVFLVMDFARRLIAYIVSIFAQAPGVTVRAGGAWITGCILCIVLFWRRYLEYRYTQRPFRFSQRNSGTTAK